LRKSECEFAFMVSLYAALKADSSFIVRKGVVPFRMCGLDRISSKAVKVVLPGVQTQICQEMTGECRMLNASGCFRYCACFTTLHGDMLYSIDGLLFRREHERGSPRLT
jgi:hypothetical protein